MSQAPYMNSDHLPAAVDVEARADGSLILRSPYAPGELPRSSAHLLLARAEQYPENTLIAEQQDGEWRHLSYAQAVAGCRSVAQWLIDQGASIERPLAILSGSSINHFLMAWGAIMARVPYVPVSLSYSTVPGAYPKLDAVLDKVAPAFIYAEDFQQHAAALQAIAFDSSATQLISTAISPGVASTPFTELLATRPGTAVTESLDKIDHATVTRYMFTSGSTGMPKGVIHTHGMNCQMLASMAGLNDALVPAEPPRVLDWMPWSHVGAGVMRVTSMINAAGAIFLDTGKPVPGEFDKTIANLRAVKPTSFAGAPLGWAMLVDALEKDADLAHDFYSNMRTMQSGSAAMPAALAARIQALNIKYTGYRFAFGTSLLSTEVQCGLSRYWVCEGNEVTGLPVPGAEIKLVPFGDKYELRVRSKGTTPGYLKEPDKTRDSFDAEGFFKMGDAVQFADPAEPRRGLCFAGRVAEEFKLVTGTWVAAGSLRAEVVTAASPYVRDVVVCGLNQAYVALLIWPNLSTCAELAGTADVEAIIMSDQVIDAISQGLRRHNSNNRGSSQRIDRFMLLAQPPDPGAYEITDKGYVNQAAVLQHRAAAVAQLYVADPGPDVIVLPD